MLKRIIIIVIGTIVIIAAALILTDSFKGMINVTITPEKAVKLIAKNKNNPDFVILDVRTPAEYQNGAISGAVNLDIYAADFKTKLAELDKNKTYLVYCRTGHRSAQAAAMMRDLKFQEVYDLSGGVTDWTQKGYPLIKP